MWKHYKLTVTKFGTDFYVVEKREKMYNSMHKPFVAHYIVICRFCKYLRIERIEFDILFKGLLIKALTAKPITPITAEHAW